MTWTPQLYPLLPILLAVHAAIHWCSQHIGRHVGGALVYLSVQVGLLYALSLTFHYPVFMLMSFAALLGETLSIFESVGLAMLLTIVLYGLYGFSLHAVFGPIWPWNTVVQNLAFSLLLSVPYIVVLILQIKSRLQADRLLRELDTVHRQLVVYAQQVEELTLAAERARMARELHDTLAQGVAGLILQLEALEGHLERGDNQRATQVTGQIKSRARDVLGNSRRAIDDLRLSPGRISTLAEALKQEVEQFSTITDVPCTLDLPSSLTLPTSVTEHALRCVTEGLANIARHAHASHVDVSVEVREQQILIQVRDDGIGFNPAAIGQHKGHYGLLGLQERARLVGGSLEIESDAGTGTTLQLRLPVLSALTIGD
ncbi:MAG: sensor histidine kinase [Aggregatilineales bacterium]